jgi:hypothetical protein
MPTPSPPHLVLARTDKSQQLEASLLEVALAKRAARLPFGFECRE